MDSYSEDLGLENLKLKDRLKLLTQERDKYKKLFEVSADALSIIDLNTGRFIECNQAAIDMHGVESNIHFLNLKPSDLSPEYQPSGRRSDEMAKEYINKTLTEGPQIFQWLHSRLDGSTFNCLVSLTYISLGETNLVLAIGRDISDLINAQTKLDTAQFENKKLEKAYLEEKEKFERFVNLAPVGIAINSMAEGRFEFVNQKFSDMTGYTVDELNKMDYWQLTPKKYEEQEQKQLHSLELNGHYGPYEKEYINSKGELFPVLLSGRKITDNNNTSIWSVIQNISKQKLFERQINEAKEKADILALRLQLANDSAGIGVWEWNLSTGELLWDEWMFRLYGITKETFSGVYEAWVNSVHEDDIENAKLELENAISGNGTYEPEFRVVHPDGNVRTLKASAEVLRDSNGVATKVIGVNYDVTEKVNSLKILSDAKVAAEQATKTKSDFLANMSHEIRTPMNAILGGLQLLKKAELPSELKTILNNASFSAQSLLTIINDILDYSKIESNELKLERIQFSLTEVLESVRYDLDSIVSKKQIMFLINKASSYKEYWIGDLVRVKQILLNLASNAVKFTEEGSVQINVSSKLHQGKKAIFIEIIDTGIGMKQEVAERIFERFQQADSSTTRKYGGTGLGMLITTNLVKMMGGEISLTSKLNKGTTIKVLLPLDEVNFAIKQDSKKSLSPPNLKNKHILIAEDNAINKVLIESMLKSTGAILTIVENGEQAVKKVEESQFDIVLMDIHMPIMDGSKAQTLIYQSKPKLKVIALTANVMQEDILRYLKQGFTDHIAKPIDIIELYGTLKYHLG